MLLCLLLCSLLLDCLGRINKSTSLSFVCVCTLIHDKKVAVELRAPAAVKLP